MVKRPSARSTKEEILNEFDQLLDENKKLLTQFEQLKKEKDSLEKRVPPKVEAAPPPKKRDAEVSNDKEAAAKKIVTMDHIMEGLQSIRADFGRAVNELSAHLVAEASALAELQDRVTDETEQLKLLYELEVTNETLAQLLQDYSEKANSFEQGAQQKQEAFEQEMIEKDAAWQKEQEEHNRTVKERNESTELNFKREEAEYRYNLDQQRKLDIEDFELKLKKLKQELEIGEANKKKEWAEREKVIADQETEFDELKERVEKFPKELETAIKEAKTKASQAVQREAQIKADLRAKEVDGEKRIYETKIKSLEEIVKNQVQQLQALSAKLDGILKQSQALAMKAIEGASQVSSFESMKEIAMEQAKKVKSE